MFIIANIKNAYILPHNYYYNSFILLNLFISLELRRLDNETY